MTIDDKVAAALAADSSGIDLPDGLLERIHIDSAKPEPRPRRWFTGLMPTVAAAVILLVPLAGFTAKQIFTVPAHKLPAVQPAQRPVKEMALTEVAAAVDFPVLVPGYLPEGMTILSSVLAGDSPRSNARMRVVEIYYQQQGVGGITLDEWQGQMPSAFPPAHPHADVLDTEPWHKLLKQSTADVNGAHATVLMYLLSGEKMNRVYWNKNGVNYALMAHSRLPLEELLKVARSLN